MGGQGLPWIPDCADQLAGDPITEGRPQEYSQSCPSVERSAALGLLANGELVDLTPNLLWSSLQDIVKESSASRRRWLKRSVVLASM